MGGVGVRCGVLPLHCFLLLCCHYERLRRRVCYEAPPSLDVWLSQNLGVPQNPPHYIRSLNVLSLSLMLVLWLAAQQC